MAPSAQIIQAREARTFMERPELCREYVKTPQMWLGTSTLQPGQRGAIDIGHKVSYVAHFHKRGYCDALVL
ncbi:MAG TPA: hypothetical protein VGA72_08855 [Anaerolineales bacterium]